jgi:hypothetical protein
MPLQPVLILAMTKMRSGICTAGFTPDSDPITGLRWVRPVREFGAVLPGDMLDTDGRPVQCCDVVELNLLAPRPNPPHVEDWVTDFVHHCPRVLRRLEGQRRADFLAEHLDSAPDDVVLHHTRSLCLVRPERVWARFSLDAFSGKYEARMGFLLSGDLIHPGMGDRRGVTVTDLRWRALGRRWLEDQTGRRGGSLLLDQQVLLERLSAEAVYLALGLSRVWQGKRWVLVVGVHTVPDYGDPPQVQDMQSAAP